MAVSKRKKGGVTNDTKASTFKVKEAPPKCDRRLSRAARELLKRHLLRHFPASADGSSANNNNDVGLETLLKRLLPANVSDDCPLLSFNDMLQADEDHSYQIPAKISNKVYPISILKHRRKNSANKKPESWFQCGYCQKIFATRYYLDVHMEDYHSHSKQNQPPNSVMTCPATSWCPALGGSWACDQIALEDEPYYDRGSGGWGADAIHIKHKLTKQAHRTACTTASIQQAKGHCQELMEHQCHLGPTSKFHMICDSLACPNHHYRLLEDMHPHEWMEQFRETWSHEKSHSVGMFGTILVMGLLVWYISISGWWSRMVVLMSGNGSGSGSSSSSSQQRGRKDPAGRRLLQKSSFDSSRHRPSRFWKTATKQKVSKLE